MIPESEIIELQKIIAADYSVALELDEVRKIGESLFNIRLAVYESRQKARSHEE